MRFYFHLTDFDGTVVKDEEGTELPTLAAARDYALQAARELLGEIIRHGEEAPFETVVVARSDGKELAAVPVVAALPAPIVHTLKHPETPLSPNRSEEYRRYADGCRTMAENASDPDDKTSWLKLADAWLQMLPRQASANRMPGWPKTSDEDSKASH
jgi:hypothetical protein